MTQSRQVFVVLAAVCGLAVLGAAPAAADVDCGDLPSQSTAQSYYDGRSGDLDGLDSDADGQACEASSSTGAAGWTLPGLAVLLLGALVVNAAVATRQGRKQHESRTPVPAASPVPTHIVQQRTGSAVETVATSREPLATDGSLVELTHALRRVPRTKRLPLVELYAVAHHTDAQHVLDAIADEASDLELQRWARTGYDSPSHHIRSQ